MGVVKWQLLQYYFDIISANKLNQVRDTELQNMYTQTYSTVFYSRKNVRNSPQAACWEYYTLIMLFIFFIIMRSQMHEL